LDAISRSTEPCSAEKQRVDGVNHHSRPEQATDQRPAKAQAERRVERQSRERSQYRSLFQEANSCPRPGTDELLDQEELAEKAAHPEHRTAHGVMRPQGRPTHDGTGAEPSTPEPLPARTLTVSLATSLPPIGALW
jgi:hypothetical protein